MTLQPLNRYISRTAFIVSTCLAIGFSCAETLAQNATAEQSSSLTDSLTVKSGLIDDAPWRTRSSNTVTTRTLFPDDTELGIARTIRELATSVADADSIRLVTILGRNDIVNLADLLFLQGVDSAVVRADAIEYVKRVNEFPGITRVVNTLARLHEQKLIVFASPDISSIEQLAGKKIASGIKGSGEYVTTSLVLQMLGFEAEQVEVSGNEAIESLVKEEVDAVFYLKSPHSEPPFQSVISGIEDNESGITQTSTSPLKVLPIVLNEEMSTVYSQAQLSTVELPELLETDQLVPTLAVQVIMAGYRWNPRHPRYEMSARFAQAFMDSKSALQIGDNADHWASLDFSVEVPGVQQLNSVRSIIASREEEERERQANLLAIEQARLDQKRRLLDEKQNEIDALISERLGNASDADFNMLQELTNELQAMMNELDSIQLDSQSAIRE